jgi:flagellar biosynthesis component FlhA
MPHLAIPETCRPARASALFVTTYLRLTLFIAVTRVFTVQGREQSAI